MIPAIGLIIAAYAVARLLLLMHPAPPGQLAPKWQLVVAALAIGVIVILALDLFATGTTASTALPRR